MLSFKMFLTEVTEFQTEKGSIYKYFNGRTQRNKTKHDFHEPNDFGEKELSDKTLFIDPLLAQEIGWWQSVDARKRLILTDKITLISWNSKINNWGRDRTVSTDVGYSLTPVLGRCPLELWIRDLDIENDIKTQVPSKKFVQVYKKTHPGNKIIVMK